MIVEQLVIDTRETWSHRPLGDDNITRLVSIEDRHAIDIAPWRVPAAVINMGKNLSNRFAAISTAL